jgi:hypothetical protein
VSGLKVEVIGVDDGSTGHAYGRTCRRAAGPGRS